MSFRNKTFDFFGKMINNKNFYTFNIDSQENNSEITSKIEKFENTQEFFTYYVNKDIKYLFELIDKLDSIYTNICKENNLSNSNSKIDIYISTLSSIYLLSNLISKNRLILNKAISKVKLYLNKFYSVNHIGKNKQKIINDYVLNLLGVPKKKIKNKKGNSLLILNENTFNKNNAIKIDRLNICNFGKKINNINTEIKIIGQSLNNSTLNQGIAQDITNNSINNNNINIFDNQNIIIDFETPQFPNKTIQENIINEINKNILNKESVPSSEVDNNEDLKNNFLKKESGRSLYTLASKSNFKPSSKFLIQEEKNKSSSKFLNHEEKNRISSKFLNQEQAIRDKNQKLEKIIFDKKNEGKNINLFLNNKDTKRNSSVKVDNQKNKYYQMSEVKINYKNPKNLEDDIRRESKKRTFSSTYLKSSQEKRMLKDLLVYVNDIFRKEIINCEEKLKLKQLIISKSEKLESIYQNYYENNKNKFIKELKYLLRII